MFYPITRLKTEVFSIPVFRFFEVCLFWGSLYKVWFSLNLIEKYL